MEVVVFEYRFNGLYTWGHGFVSNEYSDRWHKFFNAMADHPGEYPVVADDCSEGWSQTSWRCFIDCGTPILSHVGRSIFMHPMRGDGVLSVIGDAISTKRVAFKLKTLLEDLCKFIGNDVTVDIAYSVRRIKYERKF